MNWGNDNVIENNIFVESRDRQIVFNSWADKKHWQTKGNRFARNIIYYRSADVPLYELGCWDPKGGIVQCEDNLIYAGGKGPLVAGIAGDPETRWAAWHDSGQDARSIIADPLFVDPAKDNYQLRGDSPACKIGFKPIPVEEIGLRASWQPIGLGLFELTP